MQPAFEHVGTTPELSWKYYVRRASAFPFGWHFHPEFELTLITAGDGTRFVGDSVEAYGPGDLTLVGADLPHAYVSAVAGHHEAVVSHFRRDFLGSELFDHSEFEPVHQLLVRASRGLVFDNIGPLSAQIGALGHAQGAERTIGLLQVLVALARQTTGRVLASMAYRPRVREDASRRMGAVFGFVHAEYRRSLSLAEVAAVAHMAPAAFSRFFRHATGRTFQNYLGELRIGVACRCLATSDLAVAEISMACGFNNLANFNRRFRSLKGMTPREYRAQFACDPIDVAIG